MASIFTKIIQGEIPCHKVAETEHSIAFLDIRPLKKGHTLVVPKTEVDKIYELDFDSYADLIKLSKEVAIALEQTVDCVRIGYAVLGLEVPHAHLHLIPIDREGDLNFGNPRVQISQEEYQELAKNIHENWLKVQS